jgi:hypothetical protein
MMKLSSRLLLVGLVACGGPDTQLTKLYPDITVAPENIDFGEIVKLYTVGTEVQILNAGRAPLDITNVELINASNSEEGPAFIIDGDPVELVPDEILTVTIEFTPAEYLSYAGDLIIESNDEVNPYISIALAGSGIVGSTPDIHIDPASIAFDMPEVTGESTSGQFTIENRGDGPLTILDIVQTGPDVFSLVTNPVGQEIAMGTEKLVVVEYTNPDPLATGHTGIMLVSSTDPDEPNVPVQLIGGDGGEGGYPFPVAIIDCDGIGEVNPPEVIIMDGTLSYDPKDEEGDDPMTYSWSFVYLPDDSQAEIEFPNDPAFELGLDLAGTYEIQLVVTDSYGIDSVPTTCPISAVPSEELYVVLSWNKTQTDLDLHVIPTSKPGVVDCAYFGCCDCFYRNQNPEIWGFAGFGECVYALDDQDGLGPENVNVDSPDDWTYNISVNYFADHGDNPDVKATIRVHVNKNPDPIAEITEDLVDKDRWKVGAVTFVDGVGSFEANGDVVASANQDYSDCGDR